MKLWGVYRKHNEFPESTFGSNTYVDRSQDHDPESYSSILAILRQNDFTHYHFYGTHLICPRINYKGYGVTQQPGILLLMNSAATWALDFPISVVLKCYAKHNIVYHAKQYYSVLAPAQTHLKRNCLLRFERSIVSISMQWSWVNPSNACWEEWTKVT